MDIRVLWTIASSMGTYSDIEMLKRADDFNISFVVADRYDKDAIGFELSGKKYIVPEGGDKRYIDSILKICADEKIDAVIPQYSDELVPLSRNMDLFENSGVKVLVTEDTKMLEIANNKRKLYDYFKGSAFIPSYTYVGDLKSLKEAVLNLGYPDEPVCIKPVDGEGGKGFRIVCRDEGMIKSSYPSPIISLEKLEDELCAMDEFPEVLAMEYLSGKEYSVDCVCKRGKPVVCIPRERIETSMGIATVSIVEHNEELINISRDIISKLDLSYNINIQFKYSKSGRPMLMEVNPRVSGSLVANLGAGVNMLELSLKIAYGMPLGCIKVDWGTKMMRYLSQIFIK
jgi:carbamoyl-phosphate synthase large subunit